MTVETLKETVEMQRDKIRDMDKHIDDLERMLREEQAKNRVMMRFLKDKFGMEFIERVESNLQERYEKDKS